MLKFALMFMLSFCSVTAVADAAKPMEHEVFANAGALSVERLSVAAMQESEGAYVSFPASFSWPGMWTFAPIKIDWSKIKLPKVVATPAPEKPQQEKPKPKTRPRGGSDGGHYKGRQGMRPGGNAAYFPSLPPVRWRNDRPRRFLAPTSWGGGSYGSGYCGSSAGWGVCS